MPAGLVTRILLLVCSLAFAEATTIEYQVTDLVDVNPGEDLWRYDYTVSGRVFLQSEFFDVYFPANTYASPMTGFAAPNGDWDTLVLQQPNPNNLPPFDKGIYDAFALVDSPSLSGKFSVSFVFLGVGVPGPQAFEIFAADTDLVESGLTVAARSEPGTPVPEPSTATLVSIAATSLALAYSRRPHARR